MRTPHTITLLHGLTTPIYNPVTGKHEPGEPDEVTVPCLVNYLSRSKQFEEYGTRDDVIISVRFQQTPEPFEKAIYNGKTFVRIESTDTLREKIAVRMKEVVE